MRTLAALSAMALLLAGCSAALVSAANAPEKKLNQAYFLMREGRPFPAEKTGKEALQPSLRSKDNLGIANAHHF